MQSPVGKIVAIDGHRATVAIERQAACPRCASGKGCGAGLLSGSTRPAMLTVNVPPPARYHAGDEVRLSLESSQLLRASLLVYGMPLIGAVAALLLGWLLIQPLTDSMAMAFSISGLAAGLAVSRWQLNRRDCLRNFVPTIDGVVDVDD